MKEIVTYDLSIGVFRCIEDDDNDWILWGDNCYTDIVDNYKFKIIATKEDGLKLIEDLVDTAVENIRKGLYEDPVKKAMAELIDFWDKGGPVDLMPYFRDDYRELLTKALNDCFRERDGLPPYEPKYDAEYLQSLADKSQWNDVDVDTFLDELRGR